MKKIPHTFTIVFFLIVFAAILTWIVPAGEYQRNAISVNGTDREVVMNDSYHRVVPAPQSWQIFSALFNGFCNKADIIIFILMVGGAFWILNNSHAIDVGVMAFLRKISKLEKFSFAKRIGVDNIVLTSVMLLFSLFGAVFGMSEETIAFTVIFIPLAIQMGYDSIVGVCMCYVAAHVGFAGAMLNPFTIGIAQGIANLPLFSGLEYRFFCWSVLTLFCVVFVLLYAHRIKKSPRRSLTYPIDDYWRNRIEDRNEQTVVYRSPRSAWVVYVVVSIVLIIISFRFPMTTIVVGSRAAALPIIPIFSSLFIVSGFPLLKRSVHFFILDILLFTILFLVVGVLGYGWYVREIAALFLAMGLLSGIADGQTADQLSKLFLSGCKDILSAALIVGLASGIIFIMHDGKIIDTLLYGLSHSLSGSGEVASLGAMYLFQTLLNLIMPSGSAKAALTMPIMAQFADLINLSRQTTVLAFQFGDGFTNMITPTSGVLIGVLGIARIPYGIWLKWIWKFILALILLGFFLMLPTLWFNLSGF